MSGTAATAINYGFLGFTSSSSIPNGGCRERKRLRDGDGGSVGG